MKKQRGDRRDGRLMRELDSLHYVTGILYPNRCDNEAFISVTADLTKADEFLAKKNAEDPAYKYNIFQLVVTALLKTIHLRPKMNRFIVNGNFYQRNDITTSFVVKRIFSDNGEEALAILKSEGSDTLDTIHEKIYRQVSVCRSEKKDSSTESMDIMNKLPRWISKTVIRFVMWLDKHGWVPQSMIETDPYYTSAVLSNLGSIKMKSGYHHLTNWGTCSCICLIGEMKKRPFFREDGTYEMRNSIDLGITVDERLADGFYYSKCVKLLQSFLENPELLELPLDKEAEL